MTTKTSTPVRIDTELYEEASSAASVMSRSTAQQVAHWARIGRELEASAGVSIDDVARVLAGERSYDALGTEEQAVVRAFWAERMTGLARSLRLDRRFEEEGRPYVELDDAGRVVRRDPASSAPASGDRAARTGRGAA